MTAVAPAVTSGKYLAVLFDPSRGWGEHITRLAADYPHWISGPTEPADREAILASMVSNPLSLTWEVWSGEELVGIILLSQIEPLVGARLDFAFFDHNLVGKTALLRRFLAYCFQELRFQRISVQVPDFFGTLLSYYRRKLHFKYEGETAASQHPTVLAHANAVSGTTRSRLNRIDANWLASMGSRREQAHWYKDKWHDVLCLRLLASEFQGDLCRSIPMVTTPSLAQGEQPKLGSGASPARTTPMPVEATASRR